jgi:hypothetical protein
METAPAWAAVAIVAGHQQGEGKGEKAGAQDLLSCCSSFIRRLQRAPDHVDMQVMKI